MPLATVPEGRTPLHTRAIEVNVFERPDGLFDAEASLRDTKPFDSPLAAGTRPAGEPIHHMQLRLTVDASFDVLAVEAVSDRVPYEGHCETIAVAYGRLVGTNLMKGFRNRVRELMGETRGCTHLSELFTILPTAVIQAMAPRLHQRNERAGQRPFQIDRCHAMASGSEAVRIYHPQWYQAPAGNGPAMT